MGYTPGISVGDTMGLLRASGDSALRQESAAFATAFIIIAVAPDSAHFGIPQQLDEQQHDMQHSYRGSRAIRSRSNKKLSLVFLPSNK
jgi:hypothetical protein